MNYAAGGAATASLTNVTVSGNKATDNYTAAGIDNSASMGTAKVSLMSCTLAFNRIAPLDPETASGKKGYFLRTIRLWNFGQHYGGKQHCGFEL